MNRHEVCCGCSYKIRVKTLRVQVAPATTYTNAGEHQESSQVSCDHAKSPLRRAFLHRVGEGAQGGMEKARGGWYE